MGNAGKKKPLGVETPRSSRPVNEPTLRTFRPESRPTERAFFAGFHAQQGDRKKTLGFRSLACKSSTAVSRPAEKDHVPW